MAKPVTPAAQRSNVKNPNHPTYLADRANRISLGQPKVPPPPPPTASSEPPKK